MRIWHDIVNDPQPIYPELNKMVLVTAQWDQHLYTTVAYMNEDKRFYNRPSYQMPINCDKSEYCVGDRVIAWQYIPDPYDPTSL